jgi:trimeric autotransporter adhesin
MKRMSPAAAVLVTVSLAGGLLAAAVPPALGASSSPGIITTFAGGAGRGQTDNVAQDPTSVVAGLGGAVYVGDDGVVREFTSTSSYERVAAGIGPNGVSRGKDRLATQTAVGQVTGEAVDAAGNLVVASGVHIQVLAASTGTFYGQAMTAGHMYTIATVPSGVVPPFATGVAIDSDGNVVISNEVIYSNAVDSQVLVFAASTGTFYGQAMTAGQLYTIAGGTYKCGYNGDGIPALSAELCVPTGVAVDSAGNVLVADTDNDRIRVIADSTGTFYGQAMTAGDIYTIAGGGTAGLGDGGPATEAELTFPEGVAVDTAGNVLIADTGDNRIRAVADSTGTFYGQAMTAGDIYTVAGTGASGYSGNGVPATEAKLDSPEAVATDEAGNVLVADTGNDRVRVLAATSGTFYRRSMTAGDIYTVAGDGSQFFSGDGHPARDAELQDDGTLAVSGSGDVVIGNYYGNRIRVVAGSSGTRFGRAMTARDIYTIAGTGKEGYSGDGGPGSAAELNGPGGVATDSAGNVLIAASHNNRVRVVAAVSGTFYGQAMTAGDIYTIAGDGTKGYAGDGGTATSAELYWPGGLTVDAHGNVLISDNGNDRIRVVAAVSGTFYGQAMTAGDIYTIASGLNLGYRTTPPARGNSGIAGLAVDHSGNVIIPSQFEVKVLAASTGTFYGQAMTAGDIYTIAGTGSSGGWKNGVPATSAGLGGVQSVAVDSAGNVIITDWGNHKVGVLAAASGTFYGQAMTAGDLYDIAGTIDTGFYGDGGPGRSARLTNPAGVAVNGAGDVLIADSGNDRVREVFG